MIEPKVIKQGAKRVWVLGDLHFGVRANSVEWLNIQKDFFENITKIIDIIKKPSTPDFNEDCNHCQFVQQQLN